MKTQWQHAAAEDTTNKAATEQMEAHEAAMAAHLAQQAMAAALIAGATTEEAIATGQATSKAVTGVGSSGPMQDCATCMVTSATWRKHQATQQLITSSKQRTGGHGKGRTQLPLGKGWISVTTTRARITII